MSESAAGIEGHERRDPLWFTVHANGVAEIIFNSPSTLNAVDSEFARQWHEAAVEVRDRADIKAVLVAANGPAFSAGGNLAEIRSAGDGGQDAAEAVTALADLIHEGHQIFLETPKPMVTAVHGAVAGGGFGFALVGDYLIAGESSKFMSKYAGVGLTPDCGVSVLLPQVVGTGRALQLTLQDRTLTASEALDWGIAAEVVADEDLMTRARAVAAEWVGGSWQAFGQAKRLIRASGYRSLRDSLDDEAATIGSRSVSDDARARIAAFLDRPQRR